MIEWRVRLLRTLFFYFSLFNSSRKLVLITASIFP